jgi:predicted metal-dependent phosphoesterase TrpH
MSRGFDLHTHSTASDGSLSPAALVRHGVAQGVKVLALTDHDTVDGIQEATQEAGEYDVIFVPGIEISVTWHGATIHMVGLNINPDNPELTTGLERLKAFREWRAREMALRLEKHQIQGAYEGASNLAEGGLISRTHFARYLVNNNFAPDMKRAFKRYLLKGKPGYVAGQWAELDEAVNWIKHAGGQAIIAHPARYSMTKTRLGKLLNEFKQCGGHGIEVVSGSHSSDECGRMAQLAIKHDLLASCGSDYHGPGITWRELGAIPSLPEECTPVWHDWEICAVTSN